MKELRIGIARPGYRGCTLVIVDGNDEPSFTHRSILNHKHWRKNRTRFLGVGSTQHQKGSSGFSAIQKIDITIVDGSPYFGKVLAQSLNFGNSRAQYHCFFPVAVLIESSARKYYCYARHTQNHGLYGPFPPTRHSPPPDYLRCNTLKTKGIKTTA